MGDSHGTKRIESHDRVHRSGGRWKAMTLKKAFLLLSSMLLTGCMMAPAHQDPRWTDDALAAQPAHAAPVFVPTLRLSEDERTDLHLHEACILSHLAEL